MGERSAECERTGERRVQVLFMDYLTCPGYNPPKASIRIIASSSSRLYGCYRPPLRHSLSQPRSASILHPPRHPAPPSLSRDANLHRCVAATPFFYRPSPPLPPPVVVVAASVAQLRGVVRLLRAISKSYYRTCHPMKTSFRPVGV